MLVLSRHKNEKLILAIDGEILAKIVVIEIRGDKVRLGCDAPRHIACHRQEMWDAIQRNAGVDSNPDRLRARAQYLRDQAAELEKQAAAAVQAGGAA